MRVDILMRMYVENALSHGIKEQMCGEREKEAHRERERIGKRESGEGDRERGER